MPTATKFFKTEYLVFSFFSVLSAFGVIGIWYYNYTDTEEISNIDSEMTTNATFLNDTCQYIGLINDGVCHDEANIEQCGFESIGKFENWPLEGQVNVFVLNGGYVHCPADALDPKKCVRHYYLRIKTNLLCHLAAENKLSCTLPRLFNLLYGPRKISTLVLTVVSAQRRANPGQISMV